MAFPKELKYTADHEWVKLSEDGKTATIGLTNYAQEQLGDIVFIDLPEEGDDIEIEDSFADVESVKSVSEVYSPVTGEISKVNEDLDDAPEKVNEAPYEAWIVEITNISEITDELLDAEGYEKLVEEEA
ncbi:glycine cleavage system protein GcvH [Vagococcus humatus]|uniref:Glycine cleavage system H protein n=1 Tax=Vagococcus humatus TaxID=1889241 RepID=A0A3S0AY17_9ENTE|nr:glycine cleavage system protein GcvH [Vagococcus humatus]RST89779.1 glycine cleavage system protein H [Vagococcus humatus]